MAKYYHITKPENVARILKEGLRPRKEGGLTIKSRKRGKVFLWTNKEVLSSAMDEGGDFPYAVLAVEVPGSVKLSRDSEDSSDQFSDNIKVTRSRIPPSKIKLLKVVSSSNEAWSNFPDYATVLEEPKSEYQKYMESKSLSKGSK